MSVSRLLDIHKEYGLRRDVDPVLVLSAFLGHFWPKSDTEERNRLSHYLLQPDNDKDIKNRVKVGTFQDKNGSSNLLGIFLRQMLWSKPDSVESRWELTKTKMDKENDPKIKIQKFEKFFNSITYHPLNHWLLGKVNSNLQLGTNLAKCLCFFEKEELENISKRIRSIECHDEAEEQIIKTLLQLKEAHIPDNSQDKESMADSDAFDPAQSKAKDFGSLFKQMAEDLNSFLSLDFKLLSKSRILLYLERLVNLYALLYYLRITCQHKDGSDNAPPEGDHPLMLPLCSNQVDNTFKSISTSCFQLYRQKAECFWRGHILDRIKINLQVLNCDVQSASEIFDEFIKHDIDIFGYTLESVRGKTFITEIKENLKKLEGLNTPPAEKLTDAYLLYNLKGHRTLARMKWFFDWQGPGAGIVAPETGLGKHFNLQPQLLELLVIIFYSRHQSKPYSLSLENFVKEMRTRYGIILGYAPDLASVLTSQGLPVPADYLLRKNFVTVRNMLKNLNMLESLSDKANYIRCPFAFIKEES